MQKGVDFWEKNSSAMVGVCTMLIVTPIVTDLGFWRVNLSRGESKRGLDAIE